jgi:hypothetical protein
MNDRQVNRHSHQRRQRKANPQPRPWLLPYIAHLRRPRSQSFTAAAYRAAFPEG